MPNAVPNQNVEANAMQAAWLASLRAFGRVQSRSLLRPLAAATAAAAAAARAHLSCLAHSPAVFLFLSPFFGPFFFFPADDAGFSYSQVSPTSVGSTAAAATPATPATPATTATTASPPTPSTNIVLGTVAPLSTEPCIGSEQRQTNLASPFNQRDGSPDSHKSALQLHIFGLPLINQASS